MEAITKNAVDKAKGGARGAMLTGIQCVGGRVECSHARACAPLPRTCAHAHMQAVRLSVADHGIAGRAPVLLPALDTASTGMPAAIASQRSSKTRSLCTLGTLECIWCRTGSTLSVLGVSRVHPRPR